MTNIIKRNNNGKTGTTGTGLMTPFSGWVDGVLQNALDRFFDDDFPTPGRATGRMQVPVNIRETANSYELELVAPGLSKEQFQVNLNNDLLTVSFEQKEEHNEENKQGGYLRREYRMQSFMRSFTIDDTVDAEKIKAQYHDGVLHISLPKKEGAQKFLKRIEIS